MVGLDTGFFVAYMNKEKDAAALWEELARSNMPPVVSLLTIGELLYISFRLDKPELGKKMVESIYVATNVLSLDREIVERAASLKAGRGIPYVDSLILATFLTAGCREIHTTDKKHFSGINIKGVKLIFHCT